MDCVGFDSSTQREAPRSIAGFLEMHIANLTNANSPAASRTPARLSVAFPSPPTSHESDSYGKCSRADSLVDLAMQDITPKFLGVTQKKPLLSCVIKGTQLPSRRGPVGSSTDLDGNHPRSIMNPPTNLDSINYKIANGLFNNYLERVVTQYPIYHRNDVTAAFNAVYVPISSPRQATSRDRYIVSIIMALSLSTAARTKQREANVLASLFVRQAMHYLPEVTTNDIPGLQAILLLTQYVFLNPGMADVWLLTGLISQAVIDLGLHQELPNDAQVTAYQRDMRRRLFWCAWEMEIGVCCIFQYPFTLPTRRSHISVEFPMEVDDTAITQAGIDTNGRISKFTSRRICEFRLLEAEIASVMWHDEPLPQGFPAIDQWKLHCMQRIITWRNEIYESADNNKDPNFHERWTEMKLYSDITVPYVSVALHRPTKVVPSPPTDQLLDAFKSAVKVAQGYCQQNDADYGRIKYVFHPCHHVFDCATVFLRILGNCQHQISSIYTIEVIEEYMKVFSMCFQNISERWAAARRCLEEYERLLEPVKLGYHEYLAHRAIQARASETPSDTLYSNNSFADQMDDTVNSWSIFNPTASSTSSDPPSAVSYNAPYDWYAEFDLDFGREYGAVHQMDSQFSPSVAL